MSWIERDLKHIWHPCSQMKDYRDFPQMIINHAKGSYLTLESGQQVIDAISSWWCKNLGHNHPRLKKALQRQLSCYEHVLGANTYQKPLIELSEKLAELSSLKKVFYASEGSTAVEIAIKMSLHLRFLQGQSEKIQMMALKNGYHGESLMAMNVSDLELYRKPYEALFHPIHFLHSIPYVTSTQDPLFQDCSLIWPKIEAQLKPLAKNLSFLIFEPLLQATAGMLIYSADFLRRLQQFAKQHDIHLIADEIMTGFGRTGTALACQQAGITPDFICLSKGLTGGFLPMSAVLLPDKFYDLCFDDYQTGKSFLHSNTFSGNALAANVALEFMKILEEENYYDRAAEMSQLLRNLMEDVVQATDKLPNGKFPNGKLQNCRSIGAVVAADLKNTETPRLGHKVYQSAVKLGALLRPLGNTIYWTPPLNTKKSTLIKLRDITIQAIQQSV